MMDDRMTACEGGLAALPHLNRRYYFRMTGGEGAADVETATFGKDGRRPRPSDPQ